MTVGEYIKLLESVGDELELILDDEFGVLGVSVAMNVCNEPIAFIERVAR